MDIIPAPLKEFQIYGEDLVVYVEAVPPARAVFPDSTFYVINLSLKSGNVHVASIGRNARSFPEKRLRVGRLAVEHFIEELRDQAETARIRLRRQRLNRLVQLARLDRPCPTAILRANSPQIEGLVAEETIPTPVYLINRSAGAENNPIVLDAKHLPKYLIPKEPIREEIIYTQKQEEDPVSSQSSSQLSSQPSSSQASSQPASQEESRTEYVDEPHGDVYSKSWFH